MSNARPFDAALPGMGQMLVYQAIRDNETYNSPHCVGRLANVNSREFTPPGDGLDATSWYIYAIEPRLYTDGCCIGVGVDVVTWT